MADKKKGRSKEDLIKAANEIISNLEPLKAIITPINPSDLTIKQLEESTKNFEEFYACREEESKCNQRNPQAYKKSFNNAKKLNRGSDKDKIIQACRDRLDEHVIEWIDTAAVIGPEGDAEYPPILGSGGNEGQAGLY